MEQRPGPVYYDTLLEATETLEAFGHDLGFVRLLHDTAYEKSARAIFAPGCIAFVSRDDLPLTLTDTLYLPGKLALKNVDCKLTSLSALEAGLPASWNLTIDFDYSAAPGIRHSETDFNRAAIISTPEQTVFTLYDNENDRKTLSQPSELGGQFLYAALAAQLGRTAQEMPYRIDRHEFANPEVLAGTIMHLGQLFGISQKQIISKLSHPEHPERSLIVTYKETEQNDLSGMNVDYTLGAELMPDKNTAMISSHNETSGAQSMRFHYGKRFPTDVPTDQLHDALTLGLTNDDEGRHAQYLQGDTDAEQYGLLSLSIVSVIRSHMKEYKRYTTLDMSDLPHDPLI